MVTATRRVRYLFPALLGLLVVSCSSGTQEVQGNKAEKDLYEIGQVYSQATIRLQRPPKSQDELKPELKEVEGANALFTSPNDNQPYVIHWGTGLQDASETAEGAPAKPPQVLAYERAGGGDKRYVLLTDGTVRAMTSEELQKANFPKGHKPPGK